VIDAAKHFVVIGNDVVRSEKSVELDRVEAIGTGVGSHAVYDEVDVIVKLFDLRVVAILAAVFHRQWMEIKDVEQHTFVGCVGLFHVNPDHRRLLLQQLRQVFNSLAFNNLRSAGSKKKNLHLSLLSHKRHKKELATKKHKRHKIYFMSWRAL